MLLNKNDKGTIYDVLIIGAGIVGSAIARELSKYQMAVAVIDKENDVGRGLSCHNSGVIHAGFNNKTGTLQAKLCVPGNQSYERFTEELKVPYKKTGKLVLAFDEEDIQTIKNLYKQGIENGCSGIRVIDAAEIKQLEPNASGIMALYSPETAIISPYLTTIALAENAYQNDVDFFLNERVVSIKKESSLFNIKTANKNKYFSKWLINAAGLGCASIAKMIGINNYKIYPCRGQYHVLDKRVGDIISMPIYPAPKAGLAGLGVHLTPTIDGNILIGPSAEYIRDKEDYSTTSKVLDELYKEARQLLPLVNEKDFIRNYSGIRCKQVGSKVGGYADFVIEESNEVKMLINLIGIESPGLTAAPAIASMVAEKIFNNEYFKPKESFLPADKNYISIAGLSENAKEKLIEKDPLYGEIVCRCEKVTRREILNALNNPMDAKDLKAIKYRTRCMMGRCQGGYCTPRVIETLAKEYKQKFCDITLNGNGSYLFIKNVRNLETDYDTE